MIILFIFLIIPVYTQLLIGHCKKIYMLFKVAGSATTFVVIHHFHCNNLLSVNQFSFLPGRSSCSQLLTVLNKWFSKYDINDQVDIVYTDITKAFDSVSHFKLVSVLNSFGVSGNFQKWINAFLCNRNQKVCVNFFFIYFGSVQCCSPRQCPWAITFCCLY